MFKSWVSLSTFQVSCVSRCRGKRAFSFTLWKSGFCVLEVWAFLITREVNRLWSVFPAKWRSCQAGVGCPEIGGPVPIWWLNGVCVRRAGNGAEPLRVGGPLGLKRRSVDSVGRRARTPKISPHRTAGGGRGCSVPVRAGPGADAQAP